mmetsp:Transcript_8312/g.24592  ORF Transcript_8312/g.24592 Transcript_8312/m.24592 type:complete len:256 (+) Transcript_8312:104-871(+)
MSDHPRRRYHTDRTGDVPREAEEAAACCCCCCCCWSLSFAESPVSDSSPPDASPSLLASMSPSLPCPSLFLFLSALALFFFSASRTCLRTSILHSGQLASRSVSQGTRQSPWNLCPQGRTLTISRSSNSSRQMQQQQDESPSLVVSPVPVPRAFVFVPPLAAPSSAFVASAVAVVVVVVVANSSSSSVSICSRVSLWTRIIRANPSVCRMPGPPAKRTMRPCSSGAAVMHPHWAQIRRQPKKIKKARNPDMAAKK